MKFIHLADLHIGKRVNEFSMIEDQKYILAQILNIIDEEKVDAVFVAGDVYDKAVPTVEAVQVFDDFLTKLKERKLWVFVISGNHDSTERLAFGAKVFRENQIYINHGFNGKVECVKYEDDLGELYIYMLPFIKPSQVRSAYDIEIENYHQALEEVMRRMDIDKTKRNILLAHQFVTGAKQSESEEYFLGGMDNVESYVFEDFDYVALGHIHRPQKMNKDTIRYAGSPLKYSFSEVKYAKKVCIVEMKNKGTVEIKERELVPKRELREIRGKYMEITAKSFYENMNTDDYFRIILTDEEDIKEVVGKLRSIYPNLMRVEFDNKRTREKKELIFEKQEKMKSPFTLMAELYQKQNNKPMNREQEKFIEELMETIKWGER
ncbi:MAG: exonuclease SbcCD subunit D [Lachnospiraceae bacterium]|nr:exonuclease SbcCD subunit D [Lachnospiraceae bacterium]